MKKKSKGNPAKIAKKMHKEILGLHSKLMGAHAKMEKHLNSMAGEGKISSGKPAERSRPNKAEEVTIAAGKRVKKKAGGY